jgi:NADH dehydrogenase FAD-containing subunit
VPARRTQTTVWSTGVSANNALADILTLSQFITNRLPVHAETLQEVVGEQVPLRLAE